MWTLQTDMGIFQFKKFRVNQDVLIFENLATRKERSIALSRIQSLTLKR